ncbi:hypothetical protein GHT09_012742 [Marmota monax]|uniref:Ig-like domain-containing protein n=1 Tax=Marmota monax TaxID=9995 RepID=A0A834UKQ1_MARMO|nr:hypothetical protein GHT09_012742 [Marmota monax]
MVFQMWPLPVGFNVRWGDLHQRIQTLVDFLTDWMKAEFFCVAHNLLIFAAPQALSTCYFIAVMLLCTRTSGKHLQSNVIDSFQSVDVAGGSRAQSVTQPDLHVTVTEGIRLELRCNYSYAATPYLFWYVQYPDQHLEHLLTYLARNTLVKGIKGFEAEFKESESSFNLRKSSAHLSDSAKYFCAPVAQCLGLQGELSTNLL